MMQEVGGDDTNGESTFEFVDGSNHPDTLSPVSQTSTGSLNPPTSVTAASTPGIPVQSVVGGSTVTSPVQFYSPGPAHSLPSPPPPPAALPSFLGSPPTSDYNTLSASVTSPSQPYTYSPISGHVATPAYLPPPVAPTTTQPTIFVPSPPSQNAALELPIMEYQAGYAPSSQQPMEGGNNAGMWSWIKGTVSGNDFLTKVAEKAKNSVDSMITTLDPQMKDYIYSGGDISLVVASDKEDKISPVREAFQTVFGRATVSGFSVQTNIAAQPLGYSAGLKGAEDRISYLRMSGHLDERQPVAAIENFIAELTPDRWFDIGCIILDDPAIESPINVYTQATPIPLQYVHQMQRDTSADYPLRWSGLATPLGKVVGQALQVPHDEWHKHVAGIPRRQLILMAATTLATIYKSRRDARTSVGYPAWQ